MSWHFAKLAKDSVLVVRTPENAKEGRVQGQLRSQPLGALFSDTAASAVKDEGAVTGTLSRDLKCYTFMWQDKYQVTLFRVEI
mmetsp:Transcript_47988/g.117582  ORF Transcript_47988/g.117582 Transcript_47988/m.117582 type:complete len:83 (+) Transcript_47988:67-315(+)